MVAGMETYLPAFIVFALVMAAMAVRVILSNLRIKGSCGGLGALRDDIGRPMCECGAKSGETCASDDGMEFDPLVGSTRASSTPAETFA